MEQILASAIPVTSKRVPLNLLGTVPSAKQQFTAPANARPRTGKSTRKSVANRPARPSRHLPSGAFHSLKLATAELARLAGAATILIQF